MKRENKKYAVVCNYSVTVGLKGGCTGNCEKCRWLSTLKVVELKDDVEACGVYG